MAASLNSFSHDDLEEIRSVLREQIEDVAIALKGNPTSRTRREVRWGNYRGFKVNISGHNQGLFHDFDSGAGGDAFALIMHERKCNFSEALKWARNWSGIHQQKSISPIRHQFLERHQEQARKAERERKQAEAERDQKADEDRRIGIAHEIWAVSVDANGTLADRYLTEARKIPKPARGWPDSVRFIDLSRTLHMVVSATSPDGIVQAVQGVELTPEGTKANVKQPRETRGVMAGAAMRLPGPSDKPLLIAEGPETALSLWAATGFETWATLGGGNIGTQAVPLDRTIVVCLDDDKRFSGSDKKVTETSRWWREKGLDVRLATPWAERREDKSDFNDLMQQHGEAAVRARIKFALDDGDDGGGRKRRPVAEAWKMVDEAVENFRAAAETYDPDGDEPPVVHAIKVDVAVGKSSVARSRVAEMLAKMRVIEQVTGEPKRTVAFAIPTHALGDEQAAAFEALPAAKLAGLKAAVWRGRQAPDPNAQDETMCKALPRVRDAMAVMANIQQTACRTKFDDGSEAKCPHFDECPYQLQQSQEPDVWFVAHEMLFLNKPAALGKLALIVVDEACWQDGLIGVSASPVKLALDTLLDVDRVFARRKKGEAFGMSEPGGTYVSEHDTNRLVFLRRTLMDVLQNQPDGPLTHAAVEASMLTAENVKEATGLEWRRKVPV